MGVVMTTKDENGKGSEFQNVEVVDFKKRPRQYFENLYHDRERERIAEHIRKEIDLRDKKRQLQWRAIKRTLTSILRKILFLISILFLLKGILNLRFQIIDQIFPENNIKITKQIASIVKYVPPFLLDDKASAVDRNKGSVHKRTSKKNGVNDPTEYSVFRKIYWQQKISNIRKIMAQHKKEIRNVIFIFIGLFFFFIWIHLRKRTKAERNLLMAISLVEGGELKKMAVGFTEPYRIDVNELFHGLNTVSQSSFLTRSFIVGLRTNYRIQIAQDVIHRMNNFFDSFNRFRRTMHELNSLEMENEIFRTKQETELAEQKYKAMSFQKMTEALIYEG